MNLPALLTAEVKRSWIEFRRYPVDAVSTIIVLSMFFLGLVLGARSIAGVRGPMNPQVAGGALVGFLMWFYGIAAVMGIAGDVTREAQVGTLEQVYLSPFGPPLILIFRQIASLIVVTIMIVGIAAICMLITKARLQWHLQQTIPLLLVTMVGLYGLGLILGGLALVFKRVQNLLMIVQFALLFVTMAQVERTTGALRIFVATFPLSQGTGMIRMISQGRTNLARLASNGDVAILIVSSLAYLLVGLTMYRILDASARKRGLVGHY
jgi:ABC-2 type transport system permease protein